MGTLLTVLPGVRERSEVKARQLGYPVNPALPSLGRISFRTRTETIERTLALFCVVAVANNSNSAVARQWLESEGLESALTPREKSWLAAPHNDESDLFAAQEEALWVLMWALGFVSGLSFSEYCNESLAKLFPNVRQHETSREFRERASLRDFELIVAEADLAYCLHWAVRDAQLNGRAIPGVLEPYVIEERRKALEWLTTEQQWGEISLDT